jgi:hypothetical protein
MLKKTMLHPPLPKRAKTPSFPGVVLAHLFVTPCASVRRCLGKEWALAHLGRAGVTDAVLNILRASRHRIAITDVESLQSLDQKRG